MKVHYQTFEKRTRLGTLEIFLKCKDEPITVWSNLLHLSDKKQVTCKRCLKKLGAKPKGKRK